VDSNDWPKGTIGDKFCKNNGYGSGKSGINVINVPVTGGGGHQGTSSGGSGGGVLGGGWAKIKENNKKALDRMQKQQENLKALNTSFQPCPIYQRPKDDIPVHNPLAGIKPQPSKKEPFQTGSSLEAQYSRLRVLYNMADSWEWREIYQYAKVIGVSRDEIAKYNLIQRHSNGQTFSLKYFKELKEEEARNELKKREQEEEKREKARQYEEESSRAASSLFDNVPPPQYQVTPEYFTQSASDAGMNPSQALNIILNPTSENFYDRIILTSRQNWLGGAKNTTAFGFEDLTNEQAYKYISQGYKPWDFPTLSNRLISQRGATLFENVTSEYFSKQAEEAKMTSMQALSILMNPTSENFYDRIILTSRQNWLGGAQNTTSFWFEDLTNEQAYQYISQGYHEGDMPTLSNRLISQRGATLFENVTPDYFVKQAEKTGMTPMQSLVILMNPTLENAYERVLLASRQNYLGGNHDLFVFRDIGITVGEAYDHLLTHIKNKESFSQLLDDSTNKIIKDGFTQFCLERYHTLYGSFYGEYEKVKHLQYLINTTTWEATYNYADKEGFSKEDVQYVESRRKETITFDSYMKEVFDDQVLEEWGAKDWREVFRSTGDDAEFIQVNVIKKVYDAYKLGVKYAPQGLKLLKQGWQKAVQAYKGELVKGLKIDKSVENKLTQVLGKPYLSRDAKGLRWGDTKGNNQVRIMKPNKDSEHTSQHVQYVQVRRGGKVIGRDQKEVKPTIEIPEPRENPEAHIPYDEWINWLTPLGE